MTLIDDHDFVSKERFLPKEYICEIQKLYHLPIESYGQYKSFCGQSNKRAGQKTVCPPIYRCDGIKIEKQDLLVKDNLDFGTKERVLSQGICMCESSITYHSKAMAHVKVFADKQMDMPKTICPRSIEVGSKTYSFGHVGQPSFRIFA